MSILETILGAQNGALVRQLSQKSGLDTGNTVAAVASLLKGLNSGVRQNVSSQQGLADFVRAIQTGGHDKYLDSSRTAFSRNAVLDGNKILGHILGSKQASRNLASQVQEQTGISSEILKKMLPIVATWLMGSMSRQQTQNSNLADLFSTGRRAAPAPRRSSSVLNRLLDADADGSMVDDLMGMAVKHLMR